MALICTNKTILLSYVWETSYDSKGNITREIQMKQNETLLDLQWVYDDIGNVIKYISPTSTIEYVEHFFDRTRKYYNLECVG